jgi:hypothetical protein
MESVSRSGVTAKDFDEIGDRPLAQDKNARGETENVSGSRDRFETDSRQITPKHQGTPAIIPDQRTRPANKIDNLAKSAKPPSPVQIRAAPPNFQFEIDRLFVRGASGCSEIE